VGTYRISELAGRTGLRATTLRYYEKEGLLPATRTPAGYRLYTDADADRVQFISAAKHLGLALGQIRDLLEVWDGGMCREIRDELRPMVTTQLAAADQRIGDLRTFRDGLRAALMHLHDLPAKDGPCDPACAFLRDLPDRVPAPDLQPRSAPRLPLHDATEVGGIAVACSLDGEQYDDRAARWRQVLGDAPRERTTTGGVTVQLPADRAAEIAGLVVAEQECCPFFTFHLAFGGATVHLTADAPTHAQPLVHALFGVDALPVEELHNPC
jgi:MerR family transcriptional regulator, copper efflux regulator